MNILDNYIDKIKELSDELNHYVSEYNRWWHKYVMRATEIRFIKGRLKFGGSENNAPFPSAIVIF